MPPKEDKKDGKKEVNYISEMALWKDRIEGELSSAAEWEENWGFLRVERKAEEIPAGKFDVQEKQNPSGKTLPKLVNDDEDAKNEPGYGTNEPIEMNAKLRYTLNQGKTPKEKQARPQSTQQEIGWRPNIELFGTGGHGIRRDPGIWPQ